MENIKRGLINWASSTRLNFIPKTQQNIHDKHNNKREILEFFSLANNNNNTCKSQAHTSKMIELVRVFAVQIDVATYQ